MSERVGAETRVFVAERAHYLCEYCLIAEADSYYRHQIEHIISLKHDGSSGSENLALACVFCNRNKGSDIASIAAGKLVRFFHPRSDVWNRHFRLDGVLILPVTEIGEVTVRILQMNHSDRVIEREALGRQVDIRMIRQNN